MPKIENVALLNHLEGGLIASCQPVPFGPFDTDQMVVAMALACEAGGASGLRIEGANRVHQVVQAVEIPVIGIVKRDLLDTDVRITPWLGDVRDLAQAGAQMIAVDATHRARPVAVVDLLQEIKAHACLGMADCSTVAEGLEAHALGFDCIGSTLSGYTAQTLCAEDAPADAAMVRTLSAAGCWVIAEGRIRSAEEAAEALQWGARAVTVGSALTRLEWMVQTYVRSMGAIE